VVNELRAASSVPFDKLWLTALYQPLVREADLKEWIHEWQLRGQIKLIGLGPRQRVAQWGQRIRVERVVPGDQLS
jgi:hypothetical protein